MKTITPVTLSALALTTALSTTPVGAQKNTAQMTQTEIQEKIVALCKNPEVQQRLASPSELCEVSMDNGKTWFTLPKVLLIGGGLAGIALLTRSRENKKSSGTTTVATTTASGGPEVGTTVVPEVSTKSVGEVTSDILISLFADHRIILKDGKISEITLAETKYNMDDWSESPDTAGLWERGSEQISITQERKISYIADKAAPDNNVIDSYSNGTLVTYDSSGVQKIILNNRNILEGNIDSLGKPTATSREIDTAGTIMAHYDDSAVRIVGPAPVDTSALDHALSAPAPVAPAPAPAPVAPAPAPAPAPVAPAPAPVAPAPAPVAPAPVAVAPAPAPVAQRNWRNLWKLPTGVTQIASKTPVADTVGESSPSIPSTNTPTDTNPTVLTMEVSVPPVKK